jgi:hypothetical protein
MAAASDPDVMRHICHTVLRGLDGMPEDERAVLLDTLEPGWTPAAPPTQQPPRSFAIPTRSATGCGASEQQPAAPQDIADLCLALAAGRVSSH